MARQRKRSNNAKISIPRVRRRVALFGLALCTGAISAIGTVAQAAHHTTFAGESTAMEQGVDDMWMSLIDGVSLQDELRKYGYCNIELSEVPP